MNMFVPIVAPGVLAGVVMWLLAGMWHEIAGAFYAENGTQDHQGLGFIFVSYVLLGLMMSFLYQHLRMRGGPVFRGTAFGAFIGILWVLPHGLALAAAHGEPLLYEFQNAAWHMIEQGAGGLTIALFARWLELRTEQPA